MLQLSIYFFQEILWIPDAKKSWKFSPNLFLSKKRLEKKKSVKNLQLIWIFLLSFTVAKLIVIAVIASIVMETVTAAPLMTENDSSVSSTRRVLKKSRPNHNKGINKKNLNKKNHNKSNSTELPDDYFKELNAAEMWQNPCNSVSYNSTTVMPRVQDYRYNQSYDNVSFYLTNRWWIIINSSLTSTD